MNDYMACVDDKGNILHLPDAGGLFDQDEDKMTYLYIVQNEIRIQLSSEIERIRKGP